MIHKRKKIFFAIPTIRQGGGAAKVFLNILENIDVYLYNCYLVINTFDSYNMPVIPSGVNLINLNHKSSKFAVLKLYLYIFFHKPDVVISTMSQLNSCISLLIPFVPGRTKFIARETNTASIKIKKQRYSFLFYLVYKYSLKNFDVIIAQSNHMKSDLCYNFKIPKKKVFVLYNPVIDNNLEIIELNNFSKSESKVINLITIGRLCNQKGFDLLLKAFSKLSENFYLTLIGNGEDYQLLKSIIYKLNLTSRINLIPYTDKPLNHLLKSDIYICSSRYEGMPNSVLEALSVGIPVVSFNCPGAIQEMIFDYVNGFLVKNGSVQDMANKIIKASKYSFNNQEIALECRRKYSISHYLFQLEKLF